MACPSSQTGRTNQMGLEEIIHGKQTGSGEGEFTFPLPPAPRPFSFPGRGSLSLSHAREMTALSAVTRISVAFRGVNPFLSSRCWD